MLILHRKKKMRLKVLNNRTNLFNFRQRFETYCFLFRSLIHKFDNYVKSITIKHKKYIPTVFRKLYIFFPLFLKVHVIYLTLTTLSPDSSMSPEPDCAILILKYFIIYSQFIKFRINSMISS
jgi:hypothetical protein